MAVWLIPAVKAILPFISPIVSSALPVFTTRKSDEAAAAQTGVLQQQITELQSAASQNARHVKELAEQLQKTVTALEQGAAVAESRFRQTAVLCGVAVAFSLFAIGVSLFVLFSG
ncbi:hypothetical protein ABW22_06930 [Thiobacillus denitrificans]|uniref:Methyl-accepting chemotaxis protein n=1 Tax=Thiobacillus denitrificans TaxID=36861 RepID=A0A119CWI6_THIDE|nr:hypothetical protein ABW22_06930 [Thiobacillus denitrificans]